jgi:GntR family transcriptional regulator
MLYRTFEVAFGVRIVRAQERIKAVAADARVAANLEIPVGTPLLRIERIAYTFDDKPVELRRSHCNTDAYHYRAKIN